MQDLSNKLDQLAAEFAAMAAQINFEADSNMLAQLDDKMSRTGFWQQPDAQVIAKEQGSLAQRLAPWRQIQREIKDLHELVRLNDASMERELQAQFSDLHSQFSDLKKELRFSGPYDNRDVILSVYAGAGGTDAQDWTQMLLRMYSRWAESQGLKLKTIDQSAGEEAGLKSVTVELGGAPNLYGQLAGEHGVHRLVRLSPYNADAKRQTSFAKVEVLPLIDKPADVEIDEKDLKIDVFRSAGAGGQSVNTTDSAVRVTHLPTGLTVAIQNERSQLQNRETALAVLRSKLAALQLEQHAKNLADIKGPNQSAEWGNQIRSYVLHPYKQVKDLRTGYETANAEKVLDGDLNPFLDAWLEHMAGGSTPNA